MTTENELRDLENSFKDVLATGISAKDLAEQIERFKTGFPATRLERACTPGDGIYCIRQEEKQSLLEIYEDAADDGRFSKFVPASGAATRMFKHLLARLNAEKDGLELEAKEADMVQTFMDSLPLLPFYDDLKEVMSADGVDLEKCFASEDYISILEYLLTEKGLNYASLPKGLIPFHSYADGYRTPFEEHIAEAIEHIRCGRGKIRLHFTVSPAHREAIISHVEEIGRKYPENKMNITFSEQCRKTDTIAVDMNNEVFRTSDNKILFRPAGHGALLGNLHDMRGDIVFLKNVDNVVPDAFKDDTIEYKKLLGGLLVQLQDDIFECIRLLEGRNCGEFEVAVVAVFLVSRLNMRLPEDFFILSFDERVELLLARLCRPVRVCGMVRNQGEPGGGPFWVRGDDGVAAPQIVEKSQVDMDDPQQADILGKATHFNPVDLVCGVRDHNGRPYNLHDFTDPETGFISTKSKEGRRLKAMELPGLWNGSMAEWITLFVEVPLSTFSPVKTVNDLLKEEHRK